MSKLTQKLYCEISSSKTFFNLKKRKKVNNQPMCEISPNLVTLLKEAKMMAGKRSCSFETLEVVESTF
jgi:hypothetical protein